MDVLNATESLKNEIAKNKAEWDRERKKLGMEWESKMNLLRQELEEEGMEELKASKEKADRQFKKRLQDKENLWQSKFEDIEQEIEELNDAHRQEIKMEKTKIEARLRE